MDTQTRVETTTNAAIEAVQVGQMRGSIAHAEQQEKEELIAQAHRYVGYIESSALFRDFGNVTHLSWLKQFKETKAYRGIPEHDTWELACKYMRLDRRKVDLDLDNLATFGENFLETCSEFRVGYRDLKKLKKALPSGEIKIDSDCIEVSGERIPFGPDFKEDLRSAIDRVLDEKEINIKKREKEIDRKVKNAERNVKEAEEERDDAIKRYQRLKVFEPQGDKGSEWCEEQMREILKAAATFSTLCQRFFIDPKLQDDIPNQARVEGIMTECERMLAGLRRNWVDTFIPEDEM